MFIQFDSFAPSVSSVSIDLIRAWERSENKAEGWTPADAIRAQHRYERFLRLVGMHPHVPHAPTRDIDEMWHIHMLSPKAYHSDCMRLFGEILDHDGGFGKGEGEAAQLQAVFQQTARLWEAIYGEPYVTAAAHESTNCWHDCVGRCWHACSSKKIQPTLVA